MKNLHSLALGQKENAKHGEVFFPIQKYITRLASDDPVITTHWHEEAELTRITKGSCVYQIDLVEYEAHEGDLLFIPPLLLHSILFGNSEEFYSETYVFHMNFLGGNTTDICSTHYLTPIRNHEFSMPYLITSLHPAYPSLRRCFNQITALYAEERFGYELALKSCLLQALFLLLQYSDRNSSAGSKPSSDKLKIILDYIELHYAEPISVSELAKLCYFSEYHFMRFFKKHMNMTCIQYINNVRLEKSVEQFEHGNTSILEVSLSVGFHNLSYFHRAFKKKYHMTPLSFIKRLE
ncbi:MAG: AraC family transcriptional regulator [Frisingicoccus sp.]|uniref:AraC family transcriptional regulator n=1 Tax=Frisingicoccus sp. TaxID=1918627 RepID=UPI00261E5268|nr:AraC family transcriptional regulator [Frisingicoccus sp.]MDD6233250.1 AraC family transcriptional regulator [Frisingicoccus sp.]